MIAEPYATMAQLGSAEEDVAKGEIEQSSQVPLKLKSISHRLPGLPRTWIMEEDNPDIPIAVRPDRNTAGEAELPSTGFWNTIRRDDETEAKRFKSSNTWVDHRDNGPSGAELRELFIMIVFTYLFMVLLHMAYEYSKEN